tara:strand:+ start:6993 stop:7673 length:681 start_codon:yes stop_codon:yes gene_type:complete
VSSFFLYGGDVEVSLAGRGHTIVAHTNKAPVYEFWATLLRDPKLLADAVEHLFPTMDHGQLASLQETWTSNRTGLGRSALFYILNRCSDMAYASCGSVDMSRFNPISLSHLRRFDMPGFYPYYDNCEDPIEGLTSAVRSDYVVLPVGDYNMNLFEYGKNKGPDITTIHHQRLMQELKKSDKRWLALYKRHAALFTMYQQYNITMVDAYGRETADKERCQEILIANF